MTPIATVRPYAWRWLGRVTAGVAVLLPLSAHLVIDSASVVILMIVMSVTFVAVAMALAEEAAHREHLDPDDTLWPRAREVHAEHVRRAGRAYGEHVRDAHRAGVLPLAPAYFFQDYAAGIEKGEDA